MPKHRVVFSLLGTTLDAGRGPQRWERWRPTLSLCQQPDHTFDRVELLHPRQGIALAHTISEDIAQVSPETAVKTHLVEQRDPWDFEEVYATLHDFAAAYPFDTEREEYFVHITTGTHVAQICLFLLTETRRFPARLVQTSPKFKTNDPAGELRIIDLDLSRYDSIASRFRAEARAAEAGLKSGIATRNAEFNRLITELEHVAAHSTDPILLMGPTGAGKSQLARRIFDLRRGRHQVNGSFIEINCATLRGDTAMSTLFGHKKGAFTGAATDRPGLLKAADGGVLFLDEVGELGLDEQAMLLRALEEKRFLPLGSDRETESRFQLIAGTNRDLAEHVAAGKFRDDLLARINLWTFVLPPLRQRPEDLEPNLEYELEQFARRSGRHVRFSAEARELFLKFATSPEARWPGNFRDLAASITRMATLAPAGRITEDVAGAEVGRLRAAWQAPVPRQDAGTEDAHQAADLAALIPAATLEQLDLFDRMQLQSVISVCRCAGTLSEAGRVLFGVSRAKRATVNDADRLRKFLARFGLRFADVV